MAGLVSLVLAGLALAVLTPLSGHRATRGASQMPLADDGFFARAPAAPGEPPRRAALPWRKLLGVVLALAAIGLLSDQAWRHLFDGEQRPVAGMAVAPFAVVAAMVALGGAADRFRFGPRSIFLGLIVSVAIAGLVPGGGDVWFVVVEVAAGLGLLAAYLAIDGRGHSVPLAVALVGAVGFVPALPMVTPLIGAFGMADGGDAFPVELPMAAVVMLVAVALVGPADAERPTGPRRDAPGLWRLAAIAGVAGFGGQAILSLARAMGAAGDLLKFDGIVPALALGGLALGAVAATTVAPSHGRLAAALLALAALVVVTVPLQATGSVAAAVAVAGAYGVVVAWRVPFLTAIVECDRGGALPLGVILASSGAGRTMAGALPSDLVTSAGTGVAALAVAGLLLAGAALSINTDA